MSPTLRSRLVRYGVVPLIVAGAMLLRWLFWPVLGSELPLLFLWPALMFCTWYGGLGPGLLATALSVLGASYFMMGPRLSFAVASPAQVCGLVVFTVMGVVISCLNEQLHRAKYRVEVYAEEVAGQREWFRVILASIGDAVIATDTEGRVLFLNPAAQALTGWPSEEAIRRPLAEVFHILNEETRKPAENPVHRVLREGGVVGLANHTLLLSREGKAHPIDDSAAPIRDEQGENIVGVVLVFRDVSERRWAERKLKQRAEEVETLMEVMPVGVWIAHDPRCQHITGNRAGYALLRMPQGSNLSKSTRPEERPTTFRVFHHGRELAPEELPMQHAAAHAVEVRDFEEAIVFEDGSVLQTYGSASPLFDEQGQVRGCVAAFMDVTELNKAQEALKQSETRLSLALEAAQMGIWDWDVRTGLVVWSGEHARLLGSPAGLTEATYEQWCSRVHPEDRAQVEQSMALALRQREPYHGIYRVLWPDGSVHWIEATGRGFYDEAGQAVRMSGTGVQVSERIRLEEEVRWRAEQLAQADRRKDEFLAVLSHECRNYLAPVVNALAVLRLQGRGDPAAEQARDIIERQVKQLARQLDDLLEVSRIARGKVTLHKQPVELAAVVAQAVETSRPHIEARGHELMVALPDRPLWLEADPARLCQVLSNLLINSAKYTPEGGHIWLGAEPVNGDVVLRVRDTGVGIPAELLPRVFDLFTQAERVIGGGQGGLGIGLALVRSLVEMHGGTVEVHSDGPGRGTTFTVRLPALLDAAARSTAASPAPAAEPAAASTSCRVLVVDDNRDAADSMAMLLRLAGHDVRVTYDGPGALTLANEFRPGVVLLDLDLGAVSGYDIAQRLRQEPGLETTVLVAMTGYGREDDQRRSHEAGLHYHLVKPVDPEALQQLLARWTGPAP